MSWQADGLTIEILQGDLTQQDVDAIVNAANNDLELGGGVAGAIARAGGPQIQAECRRIGPIAVGDAAITGGGNLTARFVIHAASMRLGGRTSAESLRQSTRRSLEIARDKGLTTIAFPAVGTGIAHFPMDECAPTVGAPLLSGRSGSRSSAKMRKMRSVAKPIASCPTLTLPQGGGKLRAANCRIGRGRRSTRETRG